MEPYYQKFLAHVQPKLNPIFARYKFKNELQGTSSLDQFVTRLRLLAVDCDFKIEGKSDQGSYSFRDFLSKVRSKLIEEGGKLTLAKVIQMGQNYEYARAQLKSMSGHVPSQEIHAVNKVKQGRVWDTPETQTTASTSATD